MNISVRTNKAGNVVLSKDEFLDIAARIVCEARKPKNELNFLFYVENKTCDGVAELDGQPFRATVAKE